MESAYEKGDDNILTMTDEYAKGESSGGFNYDGAVMPIAQPPGSYDKSYGQSSAQKTETSEGKQVDASDIS